MRHAIRMTNKFPISGHSPSIIETPNSRHAGRINGGTRMVGRSSQRSAHSRSSPPRFPHAPMRSPISTRASREQPDIGTSTGNDYDFPPARLLARHPRASTSPAIRPSCRGNMPGAGGIINAANHLANVAPHDGTTIHLIIGPDMMNKQAVGVPRHGPQVRCALSSFGSATPPRRPT